MLKATSIRLLATLLLGALLAGCSTWHWPGWTIPSASPSVGTGTEKPSPQTVQATTPPDSIAGMLYFVNTVLTLPENQQIRLFVNAKKQYLTHHTPTNRLRLALLAAWLPPPQRNSAGARNLLVSYNWEGTKPGYTALATLTLHMLQTRRRDASKIDALHARKPGQLQLGKIDESRAGKIDKLHHALDKAQHDKARLQKKLDELKAIEKTIRSRTMTSSE